MNEQEAMMRKMDALHFAMLDLHLYLDSHPGDCGASAQLDEYRKDMKQLTDKYEAVYGPLNQSPKDTSRWAWIADPWPWDN